MTKPLLHRLRCFVAIKIGRYTHEKKTKIIKEVKRLELARQAALPTKPSSDNVVALSKLPQQITDNKCELVDNKYEFVIEQILAAYREHPLLEVNFLADMKQKEETYLASICVFIRPYRFLSLAQTSIYSILVRNEYETTHSDTHPNQNPIPPHTRTHTHARTNHTHSLVGTLLASQS